jgi:hypothetical protein
VAPPTITQVLDPSVNTGTGAKLLCLAAAVVVLATAIGLYLRHRKMSSYGDLAASPSDSGDPYRANSTEQLDDDANALLVAADDALRTSEQELAFATAQYGEAATAAFTAAIAESRADVGAAFHRRQLLDDGIPDDEPIRRAWYVEIVERCRAADDRLDAQVEAFDKLRDLEANIETLLPRLAARCDGAATTLPRTQATYALMQDRYAPQAVISVANSAAQIQERIEFAERTLLQAREALGGGDRSSAALAIRAVEESLSQVDLIDTGVNQLAANLDAAQASVVTTLAEVATDIAAGNAAVATLNVNPTSGTSATTVDLVAAVAAAEQVVAVVRAEQARSLPDPFDALRRLEVVDARLDTALASIRDAADRAERARVMLASAIPAAQAEISAVENFITTRRGAIGSTARTRLNEAERFLEQAVSMAEVDPVAALSAAQRADALAEQAGRLANEDVDGWRRPAFGGAGPDGVSTGGLGGAVLGGILLESMLGAGGPDRGRGGGVSFGWGGRMPGSFGGPGTRVRFRV